MADGSPALGYGQRFDGGAVAHFVRVAAGTVGFVFAFGAVVLDVGFDRLLTRVIGFLQVIDHPHTSVVDRKSVV